MSKAARDFVRDVDAAFGKGSHKKGLQALAPADRRRITVSDTRKLAGSADIDTALKKKQPDAHRWDYVAGRHGATSIELHWVEVHPAPTDANVKEFLRKLAWLKQFLSGKELDAYRPRQFIWIASGKAAFNSRSPQHKRLASVGCQFVGHLRI